MHGGGGGGGGSNRNVDGNDGGFGAHGFFSSPIAGGTATPFTIGTGGNGGNGGFNPGVANPGNPGNATNFGNLFTANGGGGSTGTTGTAPGGVITISPFFPTGFDTANSVLNPATNIRAYGHFGEGADALPNTPTGGTSGNSGFDGALIVFEDIV